MADKTENKTKEKMNSSDREKLVIWAAVAPNGVVLKGSVGVFRAAAHRWAMKYNGFEVVKVGELPFPSVEAKELSGRKSRKGLPPKVQEAIDQAKKQTVKA